MTEQFNGKVALVTGASRGLGQAVAIALGAGGAHVLATARTVGGLEETDDAIRAAGGSATLVPLDLTDDPGIERLGAAIHERWGRVDLLAHCAARAAALSPAPMIDAREFDAAMAVNARAAQRLIRSIDPLLRAAPKAQAVFCDDPASGKFWGAYAASKAAARAVAQSYAAEMRETGVTVWLARPAPMPTRLRARAHPGEDKSALASCGAMAAWILAHVASGDAPAGATLSPNA